MLSLELGKNQMPEFWVGGVPNQSHQKVAEIAYGEQYRSIGSYYEQKHNLWFFTEPNSDRTAYTKLSRTSFDSSWAKTEQNFTTPQLPVANPKNPEDFFISTYALTLPTAPDLCVQKYVSEKFNNLLSSSKLIEVDINQIPADASTNPQNKKFKDLIKTLAKTQVVEIEIKIKTIKIENGSCVTADAETKTQKIKVAGLGFSETDAELIEVEDLIVGLV